MSALFALKPAGGGGGGGDALTSNPLSQFAATTSAQLAGVISDETGSGALVLANAPTLISPNLGTPSAVNLANGTGLPIGGIAALGSSVAAFLAQAINGNNGLVGLDSSGKLPALDASALLNLPSGGLIKNLSHTLYTTTSSVAGTSWYAPGLSCAITPVAGSSGILVLAFVSLGTSSSSYCAVARLSGNVAGTMAVGDPAGSRTSAGAASALSTSQVSECTLFGVELLITDYSARTYNVEIASVNAAATAYLNRTGGDSNVSSVPRTASGMLVLNY